MGEGWDRVGEEEEEDEGDEKLQREVSSNV